MQPPRPNQRRRVATRTGVDDGTVPVAQGTSVLRLEGLHMWPVVQRFGCCVCQQGCLSTSVSVFTTGTWS
jgi:hypothetical protein